MDARGDFSVVHEPFSHLKDFGHADIGGERLGSERGVIDALLDMARVRPTFVKDTTDFHYPEVLKSIDFLSVARHSIIVRDPREAIVSHLRLNSGLSRDEIGFSRVREIYDVAAAHGNPPLIIDSDDLVDAPGETVKAYCGEMGIPFIASALKWAPEVLPGWQKTAEWHSSVARSTGFGRETSEVGPPIQLEGNEKLEDFYRYHKPHYEYLLARKMNTTASRDGENVPTNTPVPSQSGQAKTVRWP